MTGLKGTSNQPDLSRQHLEWWVAGGNVDWKKDVNPLNIAVVLMVSLRGMELQCECVCVCLITWAVVLDAVGVSHNK